MCASDIITYQDQDGSYVFAFQRERFWYGDMLEHILNVQATLVRVQLVLAVPLANLKNKEGYYWDGTVSGLKKFLPFTTPECAKLCSLWQKFRQKDISIWTLTHSLAHSFTHSLTLITTHSLDHTYHIGHFIYTSLCPCILTSNNQSTNQPIKSIQSIK